MRQATAHLPFGEERVQQPPRVVHRDVVEDRDLARLGIDLDDRDVGDEAVGRRGRDLILGIRREQVRCGVVRRHREPGLHLGWQRLGIPVGGPGDPAERRALVAEVVTDRRDLPPRAALSAAADRTDADAEKREE